MDCIAPGDSQSSSAWLVIHPMGLCVPFSNKVRGIEYTLLINQLRAISNSPSVVGRLVAEEEVWEKLFPRYRTASYADSVNHKICPESVGRKHDNQFVVENACQEFLCPVQYTSDEKSFPRAIIIISSTLGYTLVVDWGLFCRVIGASWRSRWQTHKRSTLAACSDEKPQPQPPPGVVALMKALSHNCNYKMIIYGIYE